MPIFKSESANKTQQNNAKILFGSKGVAVLAKLEGYAKEKMLDTAGIDALLDVLKTKDTALLEKFANSKTGKTLAKNCKQLAAAKSFTAIMKNVKQIKVLKSFDKFGAVPSKAPSSSNRSTKPINPQSVIIPNVSDLDYALLELDPKGESKKVGNYLGQVLEIPKGLIKTGSMIDSPKGEGYSVLLKNGAEALIFESKTAPAIRKYLGARKRFFFYVDDHATGGPIAGEPSPVSGTMLESPNFESLVEAIQGKGFSWDSFSGATGNFKGDLFAISNIQPLLKTTKGIQQIEKFFQEKNKHSSFDFVVQRQEGRTKGFFLQALPEDAMLTGEELPEVHSVVLGGVRGAKSSWNPDGRLITKVEHRNGKPGRVSQYTSLKQAVTAMVVANRKAFK